MNINICLVIILIFFILKKLDCVDKEPGRMSNAHSSRFEPEKLKVFSLEPFIDDKLPIFYNDCDYKGKNINLNVGYHSYKVLMNNKMHSSISSVKVPKGFKVILHNNNNNNFGYNKVLTQDTKCLNDFNDMTRSITIEKIKT